MGERIWADVTLDYVSTCRVLSVGKYRSITIRSMDNGDPTEIYWTDSRDKVPWWKVWDYDVKHYVDSVEAVYAAWRKIDDDVCLRGRR